MRRAFGIAFSIASPCSTGMTLSSRPQRRSAGAVTIASTAVAVGASATAVGSVIDIRGMGNLTLFVQNTDVAVDGVITPYFSHADTQPAAYTNMFALKDVTPAARTFTTIASEKAAHPIGNIAADWMALSATGNGADLIVYLLGTIDGAIG